MWEIDKIMSEAFGKPTNFIWKTKQFAALDDEFKAKYIEYKKLAKEQPEYKKQFDNELKDLFFELHDFEETDESVADAYADSIIETNTIDKLSKEQQKILSEKQKLEKQLERERAKKRKALEPSIKEKLDKRNQQRQVSTQKQQLIEYLNNNTETTIEALKEFGAEINGRPEYMEFENFILKKKMFSQKYSINKKKS